MSSHPIEACAWPIGELGAALEHLALHRGLSRGTIELPSAPELPEGSPATQQRRLSAWLDVVALRLDVEVEAFHTTYSELEATLKGAAPALLWCSLDGTPHVLALIQIRGQSATLLAPDLRPYKVSKAALHSVLCAPLEAPLQPEIDALLTRAGIEGKRRVRAQQALLKERLEARFLPGGWLLRLPPGAPFLR